MDVDPAASMRIWALELELGGRTFEVPALPAADWFPILMDADSLSILNMIRPSDPTNDGDLEDMILSGDVSRDDLDRAVTEIIEQVSGRSMNAALTLVHAAKILWAVVGGELARRGFQWENASLSAALDAIYTTLMERLKPEAAKKFQALLDAAGPKSRTAISDFEAMAGPKPAPSTAVRSGDAHSRSQPRSRPLPQAGR